MRVSRWVLGAALGGLWLGAAQAAPFPVATSPMSGVRGLEQVQFYYGPPRHRYDRHYGAPPPRAYGRPYARHYGYGPPRYRYGSAYPQRRVYAPPRLYSKQEVRSWNRRHGLD